MSPSSQSFVYTLSMAQCLRRLKTPDCGVFSEAVTASTYPNYKTSSNVEQVRVAANQKIMLRVRDRSVTAEAFRGGSVEMAERVWLHLVNSFAY